MTSDTLTASTENISLWARESGFCDLVDSNIYKAHREGDFGQPSTSTDGAKGWFTRPDLASAHWRLGLVLEKQGRKQEAVAEVEKALQIKPNFEQAKKDLKRLK